LKLLHNHKQQFDANVYRGMPVVGASLTLSLIYQYQC